MKFFKAIFLVCSCLLKLITGKWRNLKCLFEMVYVFLLISNACLRWYTFFLLISNVTLFLSLLDDKLLIKLLKEYITVYNLPMKVIFFEDATSIVGKRKYANKSNSVIGFSLPLLSIYSSGLPDQKDSIANNAHDIFRVLREFKGYCGYGYYGPTPCCGWNNSLKIIFLWQRQQIQL
jgi:hypothetical protein